MKTPIKRNKTGQFDKGHEAHPKAGRPRGSKANKGHDIPAEVEQQKKVWRKQVREVIDEVPPFVGTLIDTSGMLYQSILEIRAKDELTANDVDRINKLSTSLRLNISELSRLCHRERKMAIEEDKKWG